MSFSKKQRASEGFNLNIIGEDQDYECEQDPQDNGKYICDVKENEKKDENTKLFFD